MMDLTNILFYFFSVLLIVSALKVITDSNPVHSALFLILSFFSASSIWILLQAEFLAIVLVLVYVGAVMVLFLFVVMMQDIDMEKFRVGFWSNFPVALLVGLIIALEMISIIFHNFIVVESQPISGEKIGLTKELGMLIYTEYLYAFEIAAMILLAGMVAAVALTMRKRKDSKYFDPSDAVKTKKEDRIRIINMKSESIEGKASNLNNEGKQ